MYDRYSDECYVSEKKSEDSRVTLSGIGERMWGSDFRRRMMFESMIESIRKKER
jgi:hypothetical protein